MTPKAKKRLLWLAGGLLTLLAVAALIIGLIARAMPPEVVEGRDRPEWLPASATRVFHRSSNLMGRWREAVFTISEEDFRAYAAAKGWTLREVKNQPLPDWAISIRQKEDGMREKGAPMVARMLEHEDAEANLGGEVLVFDRDASRAYYWESQH